MDNSVTVLVPATSANLGPGYDCLGLALAKYNTISVYESDTNFGTNFEYSNNLAYQAMRYIFDISGIRRKHAKVSLDAQIPVGKGLGSSAACIVGGMMGANELIGSPLSVDDIINCACAMEGHPDNTTPCILGGFVVSVWDGRRVAYVCHEMEESVKIALLVPSFSNNTHKSRSRLPRYVPYSDAAYNTMHSALLAASIITGKFENLGLATKDRIHQYYRSVNITNMYKIFEYARANGAKGVYLSGSGPTLAAFLVDEYEFFKTRMDSYLANHDNTWAVEVVDIDSRGAIIL